MTRPSFVSLLLLASIIHVAISWSNCRLVQRDSPSRSFCRNRVGRGGAVAAAAEPASSASQDYSAPEKLFSWVGDEARDLARDDAEALQMVATVVKAADGRKAENIVAIYVAPVTTLTRFLVVVTGNSRPQNQAIAGAVKADVDEAFGVRPGTTGVPEGSADSGWMLLDYGPVMLHVMTPKSRLFYNIEGQWLAKGGKSIDVSEYMIPAPTLPGQPGASSSQPAPEDDPFWS